MNVMQCVWVDFFNYILFISLLKNILRKISIKDFNKIKKRNVFQLSFELAQSASSAYQWAYQPPSQFELFGCIFGLFLCSHWLKIMEKYVFFCVKFVRNCQVCDVRNAFTGWASRVLCLHLKNSLSYNFLTWILKKTT